MAERTNESPIVSTLADLPETRERIDVFLFKLGEILDLIQDAERQQDFEDGLRLARDIASDARTLGYLTLAEAATSVEICCASADEKGLREKIEILTSVARRVRAGHRHPG